MMSPLAGLHALSTDVDRRRSTAEAQASALICREAVVARPNGGLMLSDSFSWGGEGGRGCQSNVRREVRKKPAKPCVVCGGCGRVDCNRCKGKGRTNYVDLGMLPRGEWPKWCRACGGRGLEYCSRCLGIGEYRYIMGFKFMKRDANENGGSTGYLGEEENAHRSSSDRMLNNDEPR